ncbi:Phosphoesterase HXTX [Nostocoides japonicum T1-X7]|uniref:Phosphoesterase HXTX n=1 Tax=Nostocoides japonicum T1-X7 TaxID=1194083 RepID=A0A077M3P1_9MICO|nr:2'-5' RNA ligase family protein [Tetrasphaera japonica]CCH78794.1 Phosphoesterase HXTX [Tetrasphaera japonica T1-X7]
MRTIGVAIPVPEPHGSTLRAMRSSFGDPMAASIPTHITLLPPTEVADEEYAVFTEHLRRVAAAHDPFTVLLRGTGTFRPVSPVVFVQMARGIGECEQLQKAIRSGPVRRDLDFAYHPHVTVAHHVDDDALDVAFEKLADYTAAFPVAAVELYLHGEDGVWRTEAQFALGVREPLR